MSPSTRPEPQVLIATGDAELGERLWELLRLHRVASCPSPPTGLDDLLERSPGARLLIVGDVGSDRRALDLLATVKDRRPGLAVLVLSSQPTIRLATEVIRGGAEDFVPIPYSEELLLKEVERILEAADLRDRVESLHRLVTDNYGLDRIVSRSSRMRPVLERARAAARSETPVLITGETGTGKELVARAIHAGSRRARQPLVPLNCAALPRDLCGRSGLFGHRRLPAWMARATNSLPVPVSPVRKGRGASLRAGSPGTLEDRPPCGSPAHDAIEPVVVRDQAMKALHPVRRSAASRIRSTSFRSSSSE